jgi:SAM-dependent methyltransferase
MSSKDFLIKFPHEESNLEQDEEFCVLEDGECEKKVRFLDIGAGNGMVGEELKNIGANTVVGIDIIPEAKEAQVRDRPDVYDDYFVEDLTAIDEEVKQELESHNLNCMTTVAALGFGDIPPAAFTEGYNIIDEQGIVAFNIRDKFIEETSTSDFHNLIEAMEEESILDVQVKEKYRHRLDVDGNPIYYYVYVGIKNEDIPTRLVEQFT